MKTLDKNFFRKQKFTAQQLQSFERSAKEDLAIAAESEYTQVRFRFSYDALLKLGILLTAREGYKARSVPGHHIKLLEALAAFSGTPDVEVVADTMRQKRNMDLYEGGAYVSDSEASEYLKFVRDLFKRLGL
jgi:hypothetical protein